MVVLPIYGAVVVPDSNLFYRTDIYQDMTGRNPEEGEEVVVLVARKETSRNEMNDDSFYPIALSGTIKEISERGFIVISFTHRLDVEKVEVSYDKIITVTATPRYDVDDMDVQEATQRIARIKKEVIAISENMEGGQVIRMLAGTWKTIGDIAVAMSPLLLAPHEERYALLKEDSKRARFNALENMIYECIAIVKIQIEANTDQQENQEKLYREHAIRNQMEYLQKELDEMHPEEINGIRSLELKVEEAGMNETAMKEAQKLLRRLKAQGQHSHEAGIITDYLEFLVSLPWARSIAENIPLSKAEAVLDADHFGLEKVKRRIVEQIAVMQLKGRQSGSILLFVGPPGTGKTSIGQSIAKALGREYVRVSLGGVRDEADIRGHRRTYVGAMAGRIMDGIHKSGVSNPVVVLDEVDKISGSSNQGDPASALLEVLDPEQNSTFTDHYLNVPFDLSDVFFICTANTTDTIPEPLLNRMEVIRFQSYTPIEKQQIAIRHLVPKAMEAAGLKEGDVKISDETIAYVISEYTRESGVRGLKKRMDTLCRSVAVQLVNGARPPINVTTEELQEYLDMTPIPQKKVRASTVPGVVTGLAWSQVGGDILYIETKRMKGTGELLITGQLGDVMKESAKIALSLVRSMYPEYTSEIDKEDIHIHVPDGSTPKDGPSAGIALTTALASLVRGIPVSPMIAMTGEVSLQGTVNPIGGLPEKLMAAERAGVTKVFIPVDNVDDLRDVAQEVKDRLIIVPVSHIDEVLRMLAL